MRATLPIVVAFAALALAAPMAAESTDVDLNASDGVTLKATYSSPG